MIFSSRFLEYFHKFVRKKETRLVNEIIYHWVSIVGRLKNDHLLRRAKNLGMNLRGTAMMSTSGSVGAGAGNPSAIFDGPPGMSPGAASRDDADP